MALRSSGRGSDGMERMAQLAKKMPAWSELKKEYDVISFKELG